jgi:branched-chain amino acid transport system substrate-binding protein
MGGLVLVTATACGGGASKTSSNSGSTSSSSAASAVLGTPTKATGTPVTIGFISDGKSETIDLTSELQAAKAAAQYVNDYLGGLAGHPITLKTCETKQTPAGATDCGNEMVNAKVPVVLNGASGQSGTMYKAIKPSGIPFVQAGSIDQDVILSKDATVFDNGLGVILAGPAGLARDAGVKKAAILVLDLPAASGPVKAAAPLFYKNANVTPDIIPVPVGAADMTPQVQAAIANGDGQFNVVGQPGFCTSAIKAIRTLGFKGPIVVIQQCVDSSSASATNGGYEGVKMLTSLTSDPNDNDYKVYSAVMDTYAKGAERGGVAAGGYKAVVGFVKAMSGLTGEVAPQAIVGAFRSMPETPLPLGGGITFKCDGKQVTIAPAICSTKVLDVTLDANAQPSSTKVVDTSDLFKIGG